MSLNILNKYMDEKNLNILIQKQSKIADELKIWRDKISKIEEKLADMDLCLNPYKTILIKAIPRAEFKDDMFEFSPEHTLSKKMIKGYDPIAILLVFNKAVSLSSLSSLHLHLAKYSSELEFNALSMKPAVTDTRKYLRWKYGEEKFNKINKEIRKELLEKAKEYFMENEPSFFFITPAKPYSGDSDKPSYDLRHLTHNEGSCCICHKRSEHCPKVMMTYKVCTNVCRDALIRIFADKGIEVLKHQFNGRCNDGYCASGNNYPDEFYFKIDHDNNKEDNGDSSDEE
jgi:hypothetical protein